MEVFIVRDKLISQVQYLQLDLAAQCSATEREGFMDPDAR
jgi:hypothetical protein